MERFTDRKQLFGGCSIVLIERGEVTFYEYIMHTQRVGVIY